MAAERDAAADTETGAVVARGLVETGASGAARAVGPPRRACLNCGTVLLGAHCVACGQAARVHRSVLSLGHELLHSVFHLEGKLWRTVPLLVFRPGELTRRYIDGERAKFISPMALLLFSVFLMYAVFAFIPGAEPDSSAAAPADATSAVGPVPAAAGPDKGAERVGPFELVINLEREDQALILYKMKSNGYKFSWLLVPLSIPVMWLLFCWRREFRLYDHAVFVTYSISFMTLLLIALVLAEAAGTAAGIGAALMAVVPPLHIYTQLRGAYRLSRLGALLRLGIVLLAAWIVLGMFFAILYLMGALD